MPETAHHSPSAPNLTFLELQSEEYLALGISPDWVIQDQPTENAPVSINTKWDNKQLFIKPRMFWKQNIRLTFRTIVSIQSFPEIIYITKKLERS